MSEILKGKRSGSVGGWFLQPVLEAQPTTQVAGWILMATVHSVFVQFITIKKTPGLNDHTLTHRIWWGKMILSWFRGH